MGALYPVVMLLLIASATLIIGRLGSIALTATGLPREIAKFQARSALTGAGYTTNEAESITNHPARRRIVMTLMAVGSLGSAGVIGTVAASVLGINSFTGGVARGFALALGALALTFVMRIPTLDRLLIRLFSGLIKRMADVDLVDYGSMLRLSSTYGISELLVEDGDWLADRTLAQLDLSHEGLLVLGIVRGDHYFGAPKGTYVARPRDTLLVYGPVERLAELDERRHGASGDAAHRAAVAAQREIERRERVAQAGQTAHTSNVEGVDGHDGSAALGAPGPRAEHD